MDAGRRHEISGLETKDFTHSKACGMSISIWHRSLALQVPQRNRGPEGCLHTVLALLARNTELGELAIPLAASLHFVPEADITSPLKAAHCKYSPEKWPGYQVILALLSWSTQQDM